MFDRRPPVREKILRRLRARLVRQEWPRLQMLVLVTLTGFAGFVDGPDLVVDVAPPAAESKRFFSPR